MENIDYLLVGQGIAGSILAFKLQQQGQRVMLVDTYNAHASSRVAAGMFNPITGRRFVKTWKADTIFPMAETFYKSVEAALGIKIYFPTNIIRFLNGDDEEKEFLMKSESAQYKPYFATNEAYQTNIANIANNGVSIEICKAGYVDMSLFLTRYREQLKSNALITEMPFNYSQLVITHSGIEWQGIKAKKAIFCEGYGVRNNPYFDWLPLVPAKGEVLTIHAENLDIEKIVSKGIFIVPLGNQLFKVGSTYNWHFTDEQPTTAGRTELTDKLSKLLQVAYTVVNHQAGIRPTVKDRRPIVGLHPQHPQLAVCNGLGTKGASLAPYVCEVLCQFLLHGEALDTEMDVMRFC